MFKKYYLLKLVCLLKQTDLRHVVLCVLPSGFFYLSSPAFFSDCISLFVSWETLFICPFSFLFFNVHFPFADTLHTTLGPFSFPLCISLILLLMILFSSRCNRSMKLLFQLRGIISLPIKYYLIKVILIFDL